ncbi:hypothetical protein CT19431_240183 [Cupriavidus taiwanensis]|nr:hypothetical protein CT19431_240183 [Cupriavidus taiwanensis]
MGERAGAEGATNFNAGAGVPYAATRLLASLRLAPALSPGPSPARGRGEQTAGSLTAKPAFLLTSSTWRTSTRPPW